MSVNKASNLSGILAGTGFNGYVKARIILGFYTDYYGITPRLLRDSPKNRTISHIRDEIGARLAAETDLSLAEIGQLIGRKHFRRPPTKKGD